MKGIGVADGILTVISDGSFKPIDCLDFQFIWAVLPLNICTRLSVSDFINPHKFVVKQWYQFWS